VTSWTIQKEPLNFGEVDLREILEESFSMVSKELNGGEVELTKEYSEGIPKVKGDHRQLIQVFSNLFNNAYESMKGKERSPPCPSRCEEWFHFCPDRSGGYGNRIDPENLHNIFNPFYSTKESLGLGLPFVYKIIASHQGRLKWTIALERSDFHHHLPAAREEEKK
jgi:signal transduction histidine kinase